MLFFKAFNAIKNNLNALKATMYSLKNKNILILSPQRWDDQHLSKHHYAKALANRGNNVLFISAPQKEVGISYRLIAPDPEIPNLLVGNYYVPIPFNAGFHFPKLYNRINWLQIKKIIQKSIKNIDICIDFGHYRLFHNLNNIRAGIKIFFPVDDTELTPNSRGADICLSVSINIVKKFSANGIKCHFIQHGLSNVFAAYSLTKRIETNISFPLKVGYSGNLMIRFLDRQLFKEVIKNHPNIEFHCFGNNSASKNSSNDQEWEYWLKKQSNIILYGVLNTVDLSKKMQDMDAFWLCYKADGVYYHSENSHKILEYLSTGKVIISTPVSIYENMGLLKISSANSFLSDFISVINQIEMHNSIENQKKRISYAIDNTYEKQIQRIESLISHI